MQLISVKYSRSFLPEICIALEAVLLKLHAKLAPGWALIQVNFDLIQEIGPKVGCGRFFVSGPFFARPTIVPLVNSLVVLTVVCDYRLVDNLVSMKFTSFINMQLHP